MPAKDELKAPFLDFLCRALSGDTLDDGQLRALEIFNERYGAPKEQKRRVDAYMEEQDSTSESKEGKSSEFPKSGLVNALQIAQVMGISDYKHADRVVRRLVREGILPPPIEKIGRRDYWRAEDIWASMERLEQAGYKAA